MAEQEQEQVAQAEEKDNPELPAPTPPQDRLVTARKGDTRESLAEGLGVRPEDIRGKIIPDQPVKVSMVNAPNGQTERVNSFGAYINQVGSPYNWVYGAAKQGVKMVTDLAQGAAALTKDALEKGEVDAGEVFWTSLDVGTGGLAASSVKGVDASLGMFAGRRARLPKERQATLLDAEKRLKAGEDPQKIWDETTWSRDPLGNMRTEIKGNKAKLNLNGFIDRNHSFNDKTLNLNEVLDFPEIFEAYPKLKDTKIRFEEMTDKGGYFNPELDEIVLPRQSMENVIIWAKRGEQANAKAWMDQLTSTIKHELHHNIAKIEGWPRGSSPQWASEQYLYVLDRDINKIEKAFESEYMSKFEKPAPSMKLIAEYEVYGEIKPGSHAARMRDYFKEHWPQKWEEMTALQRDYSLFTNNAPVPEYGTTGNALYMRDRGEIDARMVEIRDNPKLEGRGYKIEPERHQSMSEVPQTREHYMSDPEATRKRYGF